MKLNFKDLKQQKFSIDAEATDTVAEVKQKVAAEKGLEAAQMRLIWSGKILADTNTIGSYDIKSTDQIVCMVQKPKAAPAAASKPPATPTPAAAAASTPAAPGPAPPAAPAAPAAAAAPTQPPDTPTPTAAAAAAAAASDRSLQNNSGMMMGSERQSAIANLESMGFERPQVERAMRAAFNNPDRAVEYLLNGIPENLAAASQAPAQAQQLPTSPQPPRVPTQPAAPSTATAGTAEESEEPVNLFEAAAAANQAGRGGSRGMGGAQAAGAGGQVPGSSPAAAGAGAGATNLDFLRENPTFQQLRQLVQQQPAMLEHVLQNLSASNPQLAQTISQNQEQFIQLLAEDGGEGAPVLPPGAQHVSVTPEERDAIERLCRLGFDRDLVIQAYFACDKNEELAANFLFDQPEDEGE